MAQVNIWLREAYEGNVPPVCVRCGAPASTWKNHAAFVGVGGWPFFLVFIESLTFADFGRYAGRIWLRLPFCLRHRNYWLRRSAITFGSFAVVVFLPILAMVLFTEIFDGSSAEAGTWSEQLAGLVCLLGLAAPPTWLVAYYIWRRNGIRVAGYDKESVTLGGVCQEFVDAMRGYRGYTTRHRPNLGRFGLSPTGDRDERIQDS